MSANALGYIDSSERRRLPEIFLAIAIMSASSAVPSTWLWLARICSTSVEPGAWKSDNEDGVLCVAAPCASLSKKLFLKKTYQFLGVLAEGFWFPGHHTSSDLVTLGISCHGFFVLAFVF